MREFFFFNFVCFFFLFFQPQEPKGFIIRESYGAHGHGGMVVHATHETSLKGNFRKVGIDGVT